MQGLEGPQVLVFTRVQSLRDAKGELYFYRSCVKRGEIFFSLKFDGEFLF